MKKGFLILLVITLILVIASRLIINYFVSNISAVYPPIKKYELQMSQSDFRQFINYNKHDTLDFEFNLTDSTGNKETGFYYYVDCKIKNVGFDNLFNFKYYKNETNNFITLNLIGAFNLSSNIGGYKMKDNGVPELTEIFENRFVEKYKN